MVCYSVQGWAKFSDGGNLPDAGVCTEGLDEFTDSTLPGLIQQLMEFTRQQDRAEVSLNTCGVIGRLDIQVQERKGVSAIYTFTVEKITRELADLTDGLGEQYYQ